MRGSMGMKSTYLFAMHRFGRYNNVPVRLLPTIRPSLPPLQRPPRCPAGRRRWALL
jgi:hypothetical protein